MVMDFSESSKSDTPERLTTEIYKFMALWECLFQETAHWHSIMSIMSCLEIEYTHQMPAKKRQVIDWPVIVSNIQRF